VAVRSLSEIFKDSGSDKGTVHSYPEVYEQILAPYRDKPGDVLEIGVLWGESLRAWEEYFTEARVWGVELNPHPLGGQVDLEPFMAEGGHNVVFGDATSRADVEAAFSHIRFNAVIDDASHEVGAQIKTYWNFRSLMASGGVYVIEDIQDVEATRGLFENLDPVGARAEVIDRRSVKGRYDDVMAVYRINETCGSQCGRGE